MTCPDLQAAAQRIAEDRSTEAAYPSPAGPVTPLDLVYGFRPALAEGNLFMAHKCGFTGSALIAALRQAGFATAAVIRHPASFELRAIATKQTVSAVAVRDLALRYLQE